MRPLRAYLIVRSNTSNWEVTIHRDMESLIDAWKLKRVSNEISAVVHVGFWRPHVEAFESILSRYPGIVFLTESARFSWPQPCDIAPVAAGELDGMPVFAALSGWGYEIGAKSLGLELKPILPLDSQENALPEQINLNHSSDWISSLSLRDPKLAADAISLGISDEISYQNLEGDLPSTLRLQLAYSRFICFCGFPPSVENIIDQLGFAPPWLLNLPIHTIDLSTRASNIFREKSISYIKDLVGLSSTTIMRFPKFGRTTFNNVSNQIFNLLQSGPPEKSTAPFVERNEHQTPRTQSPSSLVEVFSLAFEVLKETEAKVLKQRMGMFGKPKTLQEIADDMVPIVTRERIRQIESKGVRRIKLLPFLSGQIESRLQRLLDGREDSIPLVGIEILDPWFDKAGDLEYPFEYLLEKICDSQFHMVRHNGQTFVTTISQEAWEECIRDGKRLLAAVSENAVTEVEAKNKIQLLLFGKGEELFSELWLEVSRWAHFAIGENEESVLVSYGYGAENLVEAVLTESDQPLHYSEITRIINQEKGHQLEVRRVHNAAAGVGLLLGRGIYGLMKHFPLSDAQSRMLVAEVEDIVDGGNLGKQWHCSEILDEIEERGLDFEDRLTPYVINIALQKSKSLAYLSRMIWVSQSSKLRGAANRIDVHQAIVSILRNEGRPMTSEEIRKKILRDRGLNYYFQIQPEDPVIRVGIGTWGLIDRDLTFPQERIFNLINEIELILRERQRGIHATEIFSVAHENKDIISESTDTSFLIGLFIRNEKIAVDKGQYLYLREWGESRRLSLKLAIQKAFNDLNETGLSINDLSTILPSILERPIEKMHIRSALQKFGATYNVESGHWILVTDDISTDDEIYSLND